ncbi:SusC/RagA family TonB-linked outer membrane protein [Segetibacter koreensis]|uniref:SusC/RagA family TonB-linked outer membrane protein n=1 Tax=Segetibacter koreensis TaxID=398037 RepID=UPI000399BCDB|nr:TonB-dependent receptor [Segetibacter koreensis]
MKEIILKKMQYILILLFLLFSASSTWSQTMRVSGKVTDETGAGLGGVTVQVKGGTGGTSTDAKGNFSLSVPSGSSTLVTSFVGYLTQEIPVNNKSHINVTLTPANTALGEVVVVGYGTQKKATLTGSVATVSGNDIRKSPAPNISNSLGGRLPGLVVVSRTGEPGNDGSLLRIRGVNTLGDNSPLVIVDGIQNRGLDRIDPATIESITVLKDASAAIYGSEAANGVILVTTKRGKSGAPKIEVNVRQGWNKPTVLPKMADAASYAQMINEIKLYQGQPEKYSAEDIKKYADGSDPWGHPNTDWFKAVIKPWSVQRYANVSLSGGSDRVKYFVSGGTTYQDGIFYNSANYYSQVNFRSNLDAAISKDIHLNVDVSGGQQNAHYPGTGIGGDALNTWWALNRQYPYLPAYWPNGLPGPDVEYGQNPVLTTTNATGYYLDKTYSVQSNVKLDVTIPWIRGLSVSGTVSYDKNILNHKQFEKPWYVYTWDGVTRDANNTPVLVKGQRGVSDARLTQGLTDGNSATLRGLINYQTSIANKHDIKVLLGTERISGASMNFNAFRRYFTTTAIDEMFAGGNLLKDNGGAPDPYLNNARLSYFGRLNYDFENKYLAEFVFREDGSYVFPPGSQYGFFPGISLGWRISEENFWKRSIPFISEMKIRGSWGQTGNDRIAPYQFAANFGYNGSYTFNQNVVANTTSQVRTPNPNITWEVANQSNIGFDAQLLHGKVSVSADYFYNVRSNILWWKNASVPGSAGLSLPQQNFAKVSNKGFEYEVGYHNKAGSLTYSVSVNGSYAKNKILDWDETPGIPEYQKTTGHPMSAHLYYQAIGIFRDQAAVNKYPHWDGAQPGDIIFKDVNNDGAINGLDLVRDDKTDIPTFTGGLNLNVGYKNFDLSVLVQGAAGAERAYTEFSGEAGNFRMDNVIGRWTPTNIDATKPRAWNRTSQYWMADGWPNNTYWVRNSNYLRVKNIELGYDLPQKFIKRFGIDAFRLYASGLNIFTLTGLKDFDPESPNTAPGSIWVNSQVYPLNKTLSFGLTVTF